MWCRDLPRPPSDAVPPAVSSIRRPKCRAILRAFSGTFDGGTDGTRRATADVNLPLAFLGKGDAFRVNVMGTEGGVAGRDVAFNRRYGVAPSLSFGLDTKTRVTLSYLNQQADDIPDYGIPWLFNQPAPVAHNNYYGFREGNYLRTKDNIATLRAEHDFNSHISVRNQTRYARYLRDVQITEPQILGTVTPATPLSAIAINRNQLVSNSVEGFLANQTDVTLKFQTGSVKHTAVAGVELDREDSDPDPSSLHRRAHHQPAGAGRHAEVRRRCRPSIPLSTPAPTVPPPM